MIALSSRRKTAAIFLSVWLSRVAQSLLFYRSWTEGKSAVLVTGIVVSSFYWLYLLTTVARKTKSLSKVFVRVVLGYPSTAHSGGGVDVIATSTTFLNYWLLILFGILILQANLATEALPWTALWMVILSSNLIFTYDDDNDMLASVLLQFGYSASVALFIVAIPGKEYYLAIVVASGLTVTIVLDLYNHDGLPKTLSLGGFMLLSPSTEPLNSEVFSAILIWGSWAGFAWVGLSGELDDRFQPQLTFFIWPCYGITGAYRPLLLAFSALVQSLAKSLSYSPRDCVGSKPVSTLLLLEGKRKLIRPAPHKVGLLHTPYLLVEWSLPVLIHVATIVRLTSERRA